MALHTKDMKKPMRMGLGGRLAVLASALVLAGLVPQTPKPPIPWPAGRAPSPTELRAGVDGAIELEETERAEEFLEAEETGEESEHAAITQDAIVRRKLSPESVFAIGDSAFEHTYRPSDGYGDGPTGSAIQKIHAGAYGGRDAFSCAGCHSVGGPNGAGAAVSNSFYFGDGEQSSQAVIRNPPAVLGLGFVQAIALEMSRGLQRLRQRALREAKAKQRPVQVPLQSKGVRFGSLRAMPDGRVDYGLLQGIDEDLVVKPFGWKGHTARLRRFAERAARVHFGMQSHILALEHRDDPDPGLLGWGHRWYDPDGDGRSRELEEGTLTAFAVYLALLEAPVIRPPAGASLRERWARGSARFDSLGCSDCHKRSLPLSNPVWHEQADTIEQQAFRIHLLKDGETPRARPAEVQLFSDLKRHDMGSGLADPFDDPTGVGASVFLTRPLWGLAESAPYLHDGRAATLPEAIMAHGGEAAQQRAEYSGLSPSAQADLHVFLLSLSRASKLRPMR